MSGRPFDWTQCERRYYTVSQVIRCWCEIPSERDLKLDPKTILPVSNPKHPLIESRTRLLVEAIKIGQLPSTEHRMGPQPRRTLSWPYCIVFHEDLKRWFEQYQARERPRFLFWKDDPIRSAVLSNKAAAWWMRGHQWSSRQAAWLFSGCDPTQIDARIDLTEEARTVLHEITHLRGPDCARDWDKWHPAKWFKAALDAKIAIPDALWDGVVEAWRPNCASPGTASRPYGAARMTPRAGGIASRSIAGAGWRRRSNEHRTRCRARRAPSRTP